MHVNFNELWFYWNLKTRKLSQRCSICRSSCVIWVDASAHFKISRKRVTQIYLFLGDSGTFQEFSLNPTQRKIHPFIHDWWKYQTIASSKILTTEIYLFAILIHGPTVWINNFGYHILNIIFKLHVWKNVQPQAEYSERKRNLNTSRRHIQQSCLFLIILNVCC